jgi:aminopeptidase N
MKNTTHNAKFRLDYRPSDFLIPSVELVIELHDRGTRVHSKLFIKAANDDDRPLKLNAEKLRFITARINGRTLAKEDYELTEDHLVIHQTPKEFVLEIENELDPVDNSSLQGLYKSGDMYCTQNEADGFRRITYFLDRPDILSKFTVKLIADKKTCPVLLSNGNYKDGGDLDEKRHWVLWEDPFFKPCYLFALVAGDLGHIRDSYTTHSGRKIDLRIYCDHGNESRCTFAMESLKKAMKWDEERFGLECDLDTYMIVAVNSFNMGAMENKGLNIFNARLVLADAETATDSDFMSIEGVIGHEYFHNWTGNRVTCRDWFQLTLKEGLTVFRDQEFSSDMRSRLVNRIDDVQLLRRVQFPEDAGALAHPIRPESYVEINNFYSHTVYEKGSEVIRMIHTLLGEHKFQKGMKKYFELFDGQAVTCEDFIQAMESANHVKLENFRRWYFQAGTPEVIASWTWDEKTRDFVLSLRQHIPHQSETSKKEPLHLPIATGLLGPDGKDILGKGKDATRILEMSQEAETFTFRDIPVRPVPSLNRDFSAPIKLKAAYSIEDLLFLFVHDSNSFVRWDAGQALAKHFISRMVMAIENGHEAVPDKNFIEAWKTMISSPGDDLLYFSRLLSLPEMAIMAQDYTPIPYDSIFSATKLMGKAMALGCRREMIALYNKLSDNGPYNLDNASIGRRATRSALMGFLACLDDEEVRELIHGHFEHATNMTDSYNALRILCQMDCPQREKAVAAFKAKWKNNPLVMLHWFLAQAGSSAPDTLQRMKRLEKDECFDIKVPNMVYALYRIFAANFIRFNDKEGLGHEYLADKIIELDKINPQVAARIAKEMGNYRQLDPGRMALMKSQLEKILKVKDLSKNTHEIISKTLHG